MGLIVKTPLLDSMVSLCASIMLKFDEGNTFIFGSWTCIANWDGVLNRHLIGDIEPDPISVVWSTLRLAAKRCVPDMITASYPTRRSTWRPKKISTPTGEEESHSISRPATTPSHP